MHDDEFDDVILDPFQMLDQETKSCIFELCVHPTRELLGDTKQAWRNVQDRGTRPLGKSSLVLQTHPPSNENFWIHRILDDRIRLQDHLHQNLNL